MSATDNWYRKPCLTEEAKQEFERRLSRSRGARSEYMRIQAYALFEAGVYKDALNLIERTIADYPDDGIMLAWLLKLRGDCLAAAEHIDDALDAYAASMDGMRSIPGSRGNVQLSFAELVWQTGMKGRFEEALVGLADFWDAQPLFPIDEFKQFGLNALLLAGLGNREDALPSAQRALAAAAKTQSRAANHRSLGLVRDDNVEMRSALMAIVDGKQEELLSIDVVAPEGFVHDKKGTILLNGSTGWWRLFAS